MKTTSIVFCIIMFQLVYSKAQPEMTLIKTGTFRMGDSTGNADEKPPHWVVIYSFFIANTETSYQDFKMFVDATGYLTDAERGDGSFVWDSLGWHKREGVNWRHDEQGRLREKTPGDYAQYPVLHVSWNDAAHYCNWLSEKQRLPSVYYFDHDSVEVIAHAPGYRLPTEAEWEYTAAGGSVIRPGAYAGIGALEQLGWYAGNSKRGPKRAGLKRPILKDIYDLSGNVWEWCHDWYAGDFYIANQFIVNTYGPGTGKERCLRGGSWNNNPAHCRITNRTSRFPDFRDGSIGFRVVRPEIY